MDSLLGILNNEINSVYSNTQSIADTYEMGLASINGYRVNEKYSWQSDVVIPEYFSSFLTEISMLASQFFQTRDFTEIYLEGTSPEDKKKCEAAKILINKTLNRKDLYYFYKLIRSGEIRMLAKVVYWLCWWEQEVVEMPEYATDVVVPSEDFESPPTISFPTVTSVRRKTIKDNFNFEVIDPRNVYVSPEYTYSLQEKQFITIRHEKSVDSILQDMENYTSLTSESITKLKSIARAPSSSSTETAQTTYIKDQSTAIPTYQSPLVDVYERYGKFWAVVTQRDEYGNPIKATIGIDEAGRIKQRAELIETVITWVKYSNTSILLRFEPLLYFSSDHRPYRPIIRASYYIHPTDSEGMTDTYHSMSINETINDTINVSNDRVMLATYPAMKIRKFSYDQSDIFSIAPNKPIPLEDPATDLQELKITDNINGALSQVSLLINQLHQLRAVFPTTMGNITGIKASTTATAVAGAEQRTDMRQTFKSLCFEYTALSEFYWMILQMTSQFALEETKKLILGDLYPYFDPSADYTYKPVTSAVEAEQSKANKVNSYIRILQIIGSIKHPQIANIVMYVVEQILLLMGSEYSIVRSVFNSSPQGNIEQTTPIKSTEEQPTSNQYGFDMNQIEQMIRGVK